MIEEQESAHFIGQAIKTMRRAAEMTQADLAAAIGAQQGSVSKWERGQEIPRADFYLKIVKVCAQ